MWDSLGTSSPQIIGVRSTDEEALVKLIRLKTMQQLKELNIAFLLKYEKTLIQQIESETSGNFQECMVAAIRGPVKQLAHSVRYCVKGWGTDDSGLIACLSGLDDYKRAELVQVYQDLFECDLVEDIKNDTSGDYQRALLALFRPQASAWADALKGAMKGLGTTDAARAPHHLSVATRGRGSRGEVKK